MKVFQPHRSFLNIPWDSCMWVSSHPSPHIVLHADRGCCHKDLDHFDRISLRIHLDTSIWTLTPDPRYNRGVCYLYVNMYILRERESNELCEVGREVGEFITGKETFAPLRINHITGKIIGWRHWQNYIICLSQITERQEQYKGEWEGKMTVKQLSVVIDMQRQQAY